MTLRGFGYFLGAFVVVDALGLLTGCANDPHDRVATGYSYVQYCGMARCDGKENR